jgi:hypothetical protein
MLVSLAHKFIFIHIPKAAGTSMVHALRRFSRPSLPRRILQGAGLAAPTVPPLPDHATALGARDALPPDLFAACFKFAVVRNPWAWQVSFFHYIRQHRKHWQYASVSRLSFAEYLDWRIRSDKFLQKDFVTDESGNMLIDFVARFENLEEDAAQIFRKIGVDATLPHRNRSRHDDYRSYYDDRTRELVADHFRDDIEMFQYSFN